MGLFFNYSKEGPGVSKNGPQKRTFVRFFETFFRNAWKMIPVCLMYCLLFIIPGLSAVGMTGVTRSLSRDKHSFGLSDFFSTIKKNWKQALCVGIINLIVTIILVLDLDFFFTSGGKIGGIFQAVGLGISFFIVFLFTIMKYHIWFMVITFNMRIGQLYLNSFKFFVLNMKNNIIMGLATSIFWVLFYGVFILQLMTPLIAAIFMTFIVCFYPLIHYLIVQYGVFGAIRKYIIDPYYEDNPTSDIELRRSLGLEVNDNSEPDFEDII
ncbi:MAG: DUF624 domain-containing protein [Ruminococcaceae bacterium]|nr:DUF624 domain-containing protein [Oscillospiraceae bacterium]